MENAGTEKKEGMLKSMFAAIMIPLALVASFIIFKFVLGNPANFEGGDPENNPLAGNYLGMVYKGGLIVPMLITLLILVITFSIERFITIASASGRGNTNEFIRNMRTMLMAGDFAGANAACDEQRGSVGNVVKSVLHKYSEVSKDQKMDKDQKIVAIQKELEEATGLELPMLEKNLVILATIASIATLMGLLGTVVGMIRAFSALAHAGAPDSIALANGISEALINTALGIGTSAIAIIVYNYFTTKIDKLTYTIDEAGFSITQTFAATQK